MALRGQGREVFGSMQVDPIAAAQGAAACPRCGYRRSGVEPEPQWQCPGCGVAYVKASTAAGRERGASAKSLELTHPRRWNRASPAQRVLTALLLLSLLLLALSYANKGGLPPASELRSELFRDPVQGETLRPPFSFPYAGEIYDVEPLASYQLWGLLVTHNNPLGFADLLHDETSVDILDVCVIWGDNLADARFHEMAFSSGTFVCYAAIPYGVPFHPDQLSNNHLLSDDPRVRDTIRSLRVGDQVALRGMLVNYRPQSGWHDWRRSSTTRKDRGNGACEVVFVEAIEVLRQGTPGWYAGYALAKWLVMGLLLAKLSLFLRATWVG